MFNLTIGNTMFNLFHHSKKNDTHTNSIPVVIKKPKSKPKTKISKCVNVNLTDVNGLSEIHLGIIVGSETSKSKNNPKINYVLIIKIGSKKVTPYIKMVNDCYCTSTNTTVSDYITKFDKELWLTTKYKSW